MQKKYLYIFLSCFVLVSFTTGFILSQSDPIESSRQSQDEKLQLYAAEFIQASVLYYSIHSGLPWFTEEEKGMHCFMNSTDIITVPMDALQSCVDILRSEGALREDFSRTTPLKEMFVTSPNPQTGNKLDTIVCFQPQSERWQKDPNTKHDINGSVASENRCHSQGGSEYCYWCTQ